MTFLFMLLEKLALAVLPNLLSAFVATANNFGIDAKALDYVQQSVASADANTSLSTDAAKLEFVTQDVTNYFKANWPGISQSFVNALIQLAVHFQHNAGAAKPASS